ncbi:MAG: sigma-54 dependent transcriptional regulator [Longimicrobiales bacterium]|nr:sigma-54 dependent transcriptional regulator [Longimicrobiales bacterium]
MTPILPADVHVLVVDDEDTLRNTCRAFLEGFGYNVVAVDRAEQAIALIKRRSFHVLLLDLYMPQVSGIDLTREALKIHPEAKVILMTGNPSVETSEEALRAGAFDYIPKPFSATHLEIMVDRALHAFAEGPAAEADPEGKASSRRKPRRRRDAAGNGARADAGDLLMPILGESRAFRNVVELARRVAATDASVFITGESGTGKELIAQYIHHHSARREQPLVEVNCAAIPESLFESEMFGHVEGAFTGAIRSREGLLEAASHGTLFLDELVEMPLAIQAKLLRVLQDGVLRRVGSSRTDAVVTVRFVAATNRNPLEAVENGTLRKDLYFRLRVVPIHIPPLRERPEDIPPMVEHFLEEFWEKHRSEEPRPSLLPSAVNALRAYAWPGNVRELRNVVEHAVVMMDAGAPVGDEAFTLGEPFLEENGGNSLALDPGIFHMDYHSAREEMLARFEEHYLSRILKRSNGNISGAARLAGVDRTTLYRLMEKRNLSKSELLEP